MLSHSFLCWYSFRRQKRRRNRSHQPPPVVEPVIMPQDYVLRLAVDSLDLIPGDSIALWPDSSGNGNDATQDTVASQPTLQEVAFAGKDFKVAQFDTVDDGMVTPLELPQGDPFSIFALWRPSDLDASCALISSEQLDWTMGNYSGVMLCYFGNWSATGIVNTANFFLLEARITPRSDPSDIFLNGTRANTVIGGGSVAPGTVTLGASGNTGFPGGCETPEIIIYNRHLSDPEAAAVRSYFQEKYNYLKQ